MDFHGFFHVLQNCANSINFAVYAIDFCVQLIELLPDFIQFSGVVEPNSNERSRDRRRG